MNKPKIELHKIEKIKNGITILKDINLKFSSGKRHILIGPSGAGKTTLLRLLNRMDGAPFVEIFDEVRRLTIIMGTHQLEYASLLGGRIIHLVNGTIVREQESEDFFLNSEII